MTSLGRGRSVSAVARPSPGDANRHCTAKDDELPLTFEPGGAFVEGENADWRRIMSASRFRTRWAAIGAAVAMSLGAGGIGISQATTSSGEMPIYVPITPCRLADTRPEFQVGPRTSPLGPSETYTLAAWGTVGQCSLTGAPTALSLNVTADSPTLATFLTLFPAASSLPNASHLNPTPGQPPTPNAVNVDLDASGEFNIYNLRGSVHVIVDVVGYYDHHTHDGRYYTESEVNAALGGKVDSSRVMSAVVEADGQLARGVGAVSAGVADAQTGWYEVAFNRDVSGCTFSATPGETGNFGVTSDRVVSVAGRWQQNNAVFVITQNLSGFEVAQSFHLLVICP